MPRLSDTYRPICSSTRKNPAVQKAGRVFFSGHHLVLRMAREDHESAAPIIFPRLCERATGPCDFGRKFAMKTGGERDGVLEGDAWPR
jgi:hypothetical protein